MLKTHARTVASPLGAIRLEASRQALVRAYFDHDTTARLGEVSHHPILDGAAEELERYFAGHAARFLTPLALAGTAFQESVWQALRAIPCGERRSYVQIAALLGKPRAARAVGAANRLNRLAIFIPCHRVVGADGSLTGYAAGLDTKKWLLHHEQSAYGAASGSDHS